MKHLSYAGDTFVTADDIADAVLEYARALARAGSADTIEIPVRHDDGTPGTAILLVGPASQLAAEDMASDDADADELRDDDLVADLQRRSRGLEYPAAVVGDDPPPSPLEDFDL